MSVFSKLYCLLKENEAYFSQEIDISSYSGRAMYGKECLGVTVSDDKQFIIELICLLHEEIRNVSDRKDMINAVKKHRKDNMGRDYIVYWPSLQWENIVYFAEIRRYFQHNSHLFVDKVTVERHEVDMRDCLSVTVPHVGTFINALKSILSNDRQHQDNIHKKIVSLLSYNVDNVKVEEQGESFIVYWSDIFFEDDNDNGYNENENADDEDIDDE